MRYVSFDKKINYLNKIRYFNLFTQNSVNTKKHLVKGKVFFDRVLKQNLLFKLKKSCKGKRF